MSIRLLEVFEYVKSHRERGTIYRDWSDAQLATALQEALRENALACCKNPAGKIVGVVHGVPNRNTKTLHIQGIICEEKGVLRKFLDIFFATYGKDWKITGNRPIRKSSAERRLKTFEPTKLLHTI